MIAGRQFPIRQANRRSLLGCSVVPGGADPSARAWLNRCRHESRDAPHASQYGCTAAMADQWENEMNSRNGGVGIVGVIVIVVVILILVGVIKL
jgi:hypothetical protein